ncbi:hypothetical protein WISP_87603 [Willisornis vidua]|uniref:Rna-directed dna polymerase from mobile element jockey-like n=1 Tax=Willisornis vidua TaxID=1566151 RepID=A0ABQ9D5F2_9PASS|nr:hypothetical protein WISP_87603 [Willisornis vidua]
MNGIHPREQRELVEVFIFHHLQNHRICPAERDSHVSLSPTPGPTRTIPKSHTMFPSVLSKCFLNSVRFHAVTTLPAVLANYGGRPEEETKPVDIVYLDSSKDFNTVLHSIILEKLATHGFDGCTLLCVEN